MVFFYSSKVKDTFYEYFMRKHGETASDFSLMLLNSERKLSQIF